jgi:phospholipid/cholesterol/gamma-HCH transport system substrate-binding protein
MNLSARTIETLTGLAVAVTAAIFLVYALRTTGSASISGSGYRLTAEFENIEGVNVGTDVRLAGIKIGSVVDQKLNPESYQAQISMVIDTAISLSEDTTAKITSEGLLGGKFVSLEPGGSDVKLADGAMISYTQSAVDIWSLISQAMFDRAGTKPTAETPAEQPKE